MQSISRYGMALYCLPRSSDSSAAGFDEVSGELVKLKNIHDSLRKLKAGALRNELNKLGIPSDDCFEKQELLARLTTALQAQQKKRKEKTLIQMPLKTLRTSADFSVIVKQDTLVSLVIGNRGSYEFLLDTGSSVTLIRPEIAWNDLQLSRASSKRAPGIGAGSSFNEALSVTLPDVKLANHSCKPINAVVVDLSNRIPPSVAGIMGIDLISQFDMEIDYVKRQLTFYIAGAVKKGVVGVEKMKQLVTSTGKFGVPCVQVKIGRNCLSQTAILDLGCSMCVASTSTALAAAGISQAELESSPALGGYGIGGGASMPFYCKKLDLSISTVKERETVDLKNMDFAIGDLPAMHAMGAQVILGVEVFRKARLIISLSTDSIYIDES